MADEATPGTQSKVGLADAVDALRAELSEAMARARDQEIQFPVGEIQVEFQIGVTREAEGKLVSGSGFSSLAVAAATPASRSRR